MYAHQSVVPDLLTDFDLVTMSAFGERLAAAGSVLVCCLLPLIFDKIGGDFFISRHADSVWLTEHVCKQRFCRQER